jgi:hypothetical protein
LNCEAAATRAKAKQWQDAGKNGGSECGIMGGTERPEPTAESKYGTNGKPAHPKAPANCAGKGGEFMEG